MQIERLQIFGFGKLRECQVAFDPERANLLIEENEFGKSTIVAAILAALYGFPPRERTTPETLSEREKYRPADGGSYKVLLEVRTPERRRLRILRDFGKDRTQVFDLSEGGREITESLLRRMRRGEEIGDVLLGLSRERFVKTCFVRQGDLSALADWSELTSQLEAIADSDAGEHKVSDAIEALTQALNKFPRPLMGRELKIETEIDRAEKELEEIRNELRTLDRGRRAIEPKLEQIGALEREIEDARTQHRIARYLRERAELRQIEEEMKYREELEGKKRRLEEERDALAAYETFPEAASSDLERWMGELDRIARERETLERECADMERRRAELLQEAERLRALTIFTPEDRELLGVLIAQYDALQEKVHRERQREQAERERLILRGLSLEEFERLKTRVGHWEPEERRRVLKAADRMREIERDLHRAEEHRQEQLALREEIAREREQKRRRARRALTLALAGLGLAAIVFSLNVGYAAALTLFALLALGVSLFLFHAARTHRRSEWVRASDAIARTQEERERLRAERANLEEHMRPMLERVGSETWRALAEDCERFDELNAKMQQWLSLQDNLRAHEHELEEKHTHLRNFLIRAGRSDADPIREAAENLHRDLGRWFDLRRELAQLEEDLDRKRAALKNSQEDEERKRESLLALLREAGALGPADLSPSLEELEEACARFREGVTRYRRLQSVKQDLEHVEQSLRSLRDPHDLARQRERVRESLARHEADDPGLASLSPEPSQDYAAESDRWSDRERALQDRLSQLRTEIAGTLHRLEERRHELLEREHELSRHLERVRSFHEAVTCALQVFGHIAQEIRSQWADALTEESRTLLERLDTEYAALHFDSGLRLRIEEKGGTFLHPRDIRSRLSFGTREQISLIARIVISRYLSHGRRLPLIFDEPFAHSDDERFARLMRFLLDVLSREHQIIIVSCHRQRHKWLHDRTPDLFDARVFWCELTPL
jgi:uncharacterized protein YhaN